MQLDHSSTLSRRSDGRLLINFGTNDYLGLRHDQRLASAIANSVCFGGAGSGSSPLVSGYSSQLAELELRLAAWQEAEAALVFTSGFAMNVGIISSLADRDDLVLSDQLNHASLIDGCRLSRAHKRVFPHNDFEAVREILRQERHRYQRALLLCESVYSMDGDHAPLAQLTELCEQYEVGLLVDEAHASGIYGRNGAGLGCELGLQQRWLGKLGTFGKALGTCGGYVVGSKHLIEYLVNHCRSYVYSTAISPTVVAGTLAALDLMPQLDAQRTRLRNNSRQLRSRLAERWQIPNGDSPIIPVVVGTPQDAIDWQYHLESAGCYVPAIRPPTVPVGSSRLRISLSAAHSDCQLSSLATGLLR